MKRVIALIVLLTLILSLLGCSSNYPVENDLYVTDIWGDNATFNSINATVVSGENADFDFIRLGDAPLLIPAYGEIYLPLFATIECDVADVYYTINGTTTSGELLGFTNNGLGRLTYTDITNERIVQVNVSMTMSIPIDDVPAIVSAKIYRNGVADNASLAGDYVSAADLADAFPMVCLLQLDQNDYIDVRVSSNADNTTVVINTMTLMVMTVD